MSKERRTVRSIEIEHPIEVKFLDRQSHDIVLYAEKQALEEIENQKNILTSSTTTTGGTDPGLGVSINEDRLASKYQHHQDDGTVELLETLQEDSDQRVKRRVETRRVVAEDPATKSRVTKVTTTETTEVTKVYLLKTEDEIERVALELGLKDLSTITVGDESERLTRSEWTRPKFVRKSLRRPMLEIENEIVVPSDFSTSSMAAVKSGDAGRGAGDTGNEFVLVDYGAPAVISMGKTSAGDDERRRVARADKGKGPASERPDSRRLSSLCNCARASRKQRPTTTTSTTSTATRKKMEDGVPSASASPFTAVIDTHKREISMKRKISDARRRQSLSTRPSLVGEANKQIIKINNLQLSTYLFDLLNKSDAFISEAECDRCRKVIARGLDMLLYDRCDSWTQHRNQLWTENEEYADTNSVVLPTAAAIELVFTKPGVDLRQLIDSMPDDEFMTALKNRTEDVLRQTEKDRELIMTAGQLKGRVDKPYTDAEKPLEDIERPLQRDHPIQVIGEQVEAALHLDKPTKKPTLSAITSIIHDHASVGPCVDKYQLDKTLAVDVGPVKSMGTKPASMLPRPLRASKSRDTAKSSKDTENIQAMIGELTQPSHSHEPTSSKPVKHPFTGKCGAKCFTCFGDKARAAKAPAPAVPEEETSRTKELDTDADIKQPDPVSAFVKARDSLRGRESLSKKKNKKEKIGAEQVPAEEKSADSQHSAKDHRLSLEPPIINLPSIISDATWYKIADTVEQGVADKPSKIVIDTSDLPSTTSPVSGQYEILPMIRKIIVDASGLGVDTEMRQKLSTSTRDDTGMTLERQSVIRPIGAHAEDFISINHSEHVDILASGTLQTAGMQMGRIHGPEDTTKVKVMVKHEGVDKSRGKHLEDMLRFHEHLDRLDKVGRDEPSHFFEPPVIEDAGITQPARVCTPDIGLTDFIEGVHKTEIAGDKVQTYSEAPKQPRQICDIIRQHICFEASPKHTELAKPQQVTRKLSGLKDMINFHEAIEPPTAKYPDIYMQPVRTPKLRVSHPSSISPSVRHRSLSASCFTCFGPKSKRPISGTETVAKKTKVKKAPKTHALPDVIQPSEQRVAASRKPHNVAGLIRSASSCTRPKSAVEASHPSNMPLADKAHFCSTHFDAPSIHLPDIKISGKDHYPYEIVLDDKSRQELTDRLHDTFPGLPIEEMMDVVMNKVNSGDSIENIRRDLGESTNFPPIAVSLLATPLVKVHNECTENLLKSHEAGSRAVYLLHDELARYHQADMADIHGDNSTMTTTQTTSDILAAAGTDGAIVTTANSEGDSYRIKQSRPLKCFPCNTCERKVTVPMSPECIVLLESLQRYPSSQMPALSQRIAERMRVTWNMDKVTSVHANKVVKKAIPAIREGLYASLAIMRNDLKDENKRYFYVVDPCVDAIKLLCERYDLTNTGTTLTDSDIDDVLREVAGRYVGSGLFSHGYSRDMFSVIESLPDLVHSAEKRIVASDGSLTKKKRKLAKIITDSYDILTKRQVANTDELRAQLHRMYPKDGSLIEIVVADVQEGIDSGRLFSSARSVRILINIVHCKELESCRIKNGDNHILTARAESNLQCTRDILIATIKSIVYGSGHSQSAALHVTGLAHVKTDPEFDYALMEAVNILPEVKSFEDLTENIKSKISQPRTAEVISLLLEQAYFACEFDDVGNPEIVGLMRDRLHGKPLVLREICFTLPDNTNIQCSDKPTLHTRHHAPGRLVDVGRGLSWREANERARILFYRGKTPDIRYNDSLEGFDVRMLLEQDGCVHEIPVSPGDVKRLLNSCGLYWDGMNISLLGKSDEILHRAELEAFKILRETGFLQPETKRTSIPEEPEPSDEALVEETTAH